MNKKNSLVGLLFLFALLSATSLFFNACKKDETKNCDRTCFFGIWSPANAFYDATIIASSTDPNGILIDDVFEGLSGIKATVDGSSFTIPYQEPTQYYSISGSGTLSDDGKTITVSYDDDGVQKTDTWTKQ